LLDTFTHSPSSSRGWTASAKSALSRSSANIRLRGERPLILLIRFDAGAS
jgi:hypothetical protein